MRLTKNDIRKNRASILAGSTSALLMSSKAFCINSQLNKVLDLVWTLTTFAGIAMIAIGVVQLVRCVIALTGGDQLQPGQLGKAIGLVAAGIAAAALKAVLNSLGISTTV